MVQPRGHRIHSVNSAVGNRPAYADRDDAHERRWAHPGDRGDIFTAPPRLSLTTVDPSLVGRPAAAVGETAHSDGGTPPAA